MQKRYCNSCERKLLLSPDNFRKVKGNYLHQCRICEIKSRRKRCRQMIRMAQDVRAGRIITHSLRIEAEMSMLVLHGKNPDTISAAAADKILKPILLKGEYHG